MITLNMGTSTNHLCIAQMLQSLQVQPCQDIRPKPNQTVCTALAPTSKQCVPVRREQRNASQGPVLSVYNYAVTLAVAVVLTESPVQFAVGSGPNSYGCKPLCTSGCTCLGKYSKERLGQAGCEEMVQRRGANPECYLLTYPPVPTFHRWTCSNWSNASAGSGARV